MEQFLDSNGIDISYCRVQGYDGAGAVASKSQDVAAHFLRTNYKVLHTHCSCRRLNLAVAASCGEQYIRNLMTNIKGAS